MATEAQLRAVLAAYRREAGAVDGAVFAVLLRRAALLRKTIVALVDGATTQAEIDEAARRIALALRPLFAGTVVPALRAQLTMARLGGEHALGLAIVGGSVADADRSASGWTPQPEDDAIGLVNTIRGPGTLSGYLTGLADEGRDAALQGVAVLTGQGGSGADLIGRELVRAGFDRTVGRALVGARTAIYDPYRIAQLDAYRRNADVVVEWEWITNIDDVSCSACLSLDGQRFAIALPFQPTHAGCRCWSRPVVVGDDIVRQTGTDWFARQDEATQGKIVPVSAVPEIRAGRLTLADFAKLDASNTYGPAYRRASLAEARQAAMRRKVAA